MATNKLFNQHSIAPERLLGESGVEATIVTDIDNYGGASVGRDQLNVAIGNDDTVGTMIPAVNMKLKNFIIYLMSKLSFWLARISNNLSEYTAANPAGIHNLGGYSSAETDSAIAVETTRAEGVESDLSTAISNEATTRHDQDNAYFGLVRTEILQRIQHDITLSFSGWNMDTTPLINVTHGVSMGAIYGAQIFLHQNGDTTHNFDFASFGGQIALSGDHFILSRPNGGVFDTSSYNNAEGIILMHVYV
jgi:hypothetical protein